MVIQTEIKTLLISVVKQTNPGIAELIYIMLGSKKPPIGSFCLTSNTATQKPTDNVSGDNLMENLDEKITNENKSLETHHINLLDDSGISVSSPGKEFQKEDIQIPVLDNKNNSNVKISSSECQRRSTVPEACYAESSTFCDAKIQQPLPKQDLMMKFRITGPPSVGKKKKTVLPMNLLQSVTEKIQKQVLLEVSSSLKDETVIDNSGAGGLTSSAAFVQAAALNTDDSCQVVESLSHTVESKLATCQSVHRYVTEDTSSEFDDSCRRDDDNKKETCNITVSQSLENVFTGIQAIERLIKTSQSGENVVTASQVDDISTSQSVEKINNTSHSEKNVDASQGDKETARQSSESIVITSQENVVTASQDSNDSARQSSESIVIASQENVVTASQDSNESARQSSESIVITSQENVVTASQDSNESVRQSSESIVITSQENVATASQDSNESVRQSSESIVITSQENVATASHDSDVSKTQHVKPNQNSDVTTGESWGSVVCDDIAGEDFGFVLGDIDIDALQEDTNTDDTYSISSLFSDQFDRAYKKSVRQRKKEEKKKRKLAKHCEDNDGDTDDKTGKQRQRRKTPVPNYFVSLQITNSKIKDAVRDVQDSIIQKNPDLKRTLIALPKLHLTIFVMLLENDEDMQRAKTVMDLCAERIQDRFETELLALDIRGIGDFRNEVVFAKVCEGRQLDSLSIIADIVHNCFLENGIPSTEKKGSFKPHITIAKMSKAAALRRKGIKKIPRQLYDGHTDRHFGYQVVTDLQLCAMLKPKDILTGYYQVEHRATFAPKARHFSTLNTDKSLSESEAADIIVQWSVQSAVSRVSSLLSDLPQTGSDSLCTDAATSMDKSHDKHVTYCDNLKDTNATSETNVDTVIKCQMTDDDKT